jgi:membrane-associated phospholipid phosphatase
MVPPGRPALRPPPPPEAARLRPIERGLLAYLGFTTVMAVVRGATYPAAHWVLLSDSLILVLGWLMLRARAVPWVAALREVGPLLLLGVLYSQIDLLNGSGSAPSRDALIRAWERAAFGMEPSRDWWRAHPSAFWSTTLHAAYLTFYPMIFVPVIAALLRRNYIAARLAVTWLMSTFLLCYVIFVLVPVGGPYYEYPRPVGAFVANWAARLVYRVIGEGSAYGAAFPSSHVAAAVVAVGATFMVSRRLGLLLVIPAVLLTVGTVYCQMHYAMDALSGLAVGAVVLAAGLVTRERMTPRLS